MEKIKKALRLCRYLEWALNEGELQAKIKRKVKKRKDQEEKEIHIGFVFLTYIECLTLLLLYF